MSGVTFPQALAPGNWGYQAGNLSVANAQQTFTDLDVADKVSIGARGAVGGISTSSAVMSVARRSAERVAEGEAAFSAGGIIGRSVGASLGRSLLVGSVISAGTNFYHAITGRITATRAAGNITADLATTATGAVAATAAAGLVAGAMGAAPGILLAGATFLAGTAAYVGVDALMRVSGLHGGISNATTGLVERIVEYFRRKIGPGGV